MTASNPTSLPHPADDLDGLGITPAYRITTPGARGDVTKEDFDSLQLDVSVRAEGVFVAASAQGEKLGFSIYEGIVAEGVTVFRDGSGVVLDGASIPAAASTDTGPLVVDGYVTCSGYEPVTDDEPESPTAPTGDPDVAGEAPEGSFRLRYDVDITLPDGDVIALRDDNGLCGPADVIGQDGAVASSYSRMDDLVRASDSLATRLELGKLQGEGVRFDLTVRGGDRLRPGTPADTYVDSVPGLTVWLDGSGFVADGVELTGADGSYVVDGIGECLLDED